jgi:hypothetical protein
MVFGQEFVGHLCRLFAIARLLQIVAIAITEYCFLDTQDDETF